MMILFPERTCLRIHVYFSNGTPEPDMESKDIEGAEGPVLEATDFSVVKVGVMTIVPWFEIVKRSFFFGIKKGDSAGLTLRYFD